MTAKQWLAITLVVVLNIVVFGALLGKPTPNPLAAPTPTWTPHPTFTPIPFPTATAILMPTEPVQPALVFTPPPTPHIHVVREGETLESIAEKYDLSTFVLRMINRIPENAEVQVGQRLILPTIE